MSLGRRPKNKFIDANLASDEEIKIKRFDVKMPFLYALTVETDYPNNAKMQTTWEFFLKQDSELDELIKEVENQPFKVKVIKTDQVFRQFTDLCPRCHNRGVPKIEKKDTRDNRERTWRNKENVKPKKGRDPEYWLTYTHTRTKKCRIVQYTNTPNPEYRQNQIEIQKYFFPLVLLNMDNKSLRYNDQ
jgi:hypothetical protein